MTDKTRDDKNEQLSQRNQAQKPTFKYHTALTAATQGAKPANPAFTFTKHNVQMNLGARDGQVLFHPANGYHNTIHRPNSSVRKSSANNNARNAAIQLLAQADGNHMVNGSKNGSMHPFHGPYGYKSGILAGYPNHVSNAAELMSNRGTKVRGTTPITTNKELGNTNPYSQPFYDREMPGLPEQMFISPTQILAARVSQSSNVSNIPNQLMMSRLALLRAGSSSNSSVSSNGTSSATSSAASIGSFSIGSRSSAQTQETIVKKSDKVNGSLTIEYKNTNSFNQSTNSASEKKTRKNSATVINRTATSCTTMVPMNGHSTIVVETRPASASEKGQDSGVKKNTRTTWSNPKSAISQQEKSSNSVKQTNPAFVYPRPPSHKPPSGPNQNSNPSLIKRRLSLIGHADSDISLNSQSSESSRGVDPASNKTASKSGIPHPGEGGKSDSAKSTSKVQICKPAAATRFTQKQPTPPSPLQKQQQHLQEQFMQLKLQQKEQFQQQLEQTQLKLEQKEKEKLRKSKSEGQTPSPNPSDKDMNPNDADLHRTQSLSGSKKVRNLHYSPNKPYSEILKDSNVSTPNSIKVDTPTASEIYAKSLAHSSSIGSPPMEIKMTTATSKTVFYRKESKTEVVLHKPKIQSKPESNNAKKPEKSPKSTKVKDEWVDVNDEPESVKSYSKRKPDSKQDYSDDDNDDEYEDDDELSVDEDDVLDDINDDIDDNGSDSEDDSTFSSRNSSSRRKPMRTATKKLLGLDIKDNKISASAKNIPLPRQTLRSRPKSSSTTTSSEDLQPALTQSIFSNIPPTINFVGDDEKVEQLPWEIRRYLKWKMSPLTPIVVRHMINRSGFRSTKSEESNDWLGYWGKHMKAQAFRGVREYQKINHFPGSFQIGRKDRLWRNLSQLQLRFGKKEFNFFPQTFCLPFDLKLLKRVWEEGGNKQKWIIKPPASARGIGIKVIHKWNQIPRKRPVIVQKYLSRPYLINDSKFDLRIYVYVTSFDPLRVYVYDDGLVRFASVKYSHATKNLNNKYMHLTNYSINKKNTEYQNNEDETACQGHKWSLKALWLYLRKRGIDYTRVWDNMCDLIIKTIISSESAINSLIKSNVRRRYSVHELFGFDIMLDENLKPWIIEVNISPSLHSNSPLDILIKGNMVKDLHNISGFMIPSKNDLVSNSVHVPDNGPWPGPPWMWLFSRETAGGDTKVNVSSEVSSKKCINTNQNAKLDNVKSDDSEIWKTSKYQNVCLDHRLWPTTLHPDERAKHSYFCQRHSDERSMGTILDILTPDDIRILVETLDEDSRKGNFERIFPSPITHKYTKYFESPRYYNMLVDAWVQRYHRMEARGVALLDSYCQKKIHLVNGVDVPNHTWCPPNSHISRDDRMGSSIHGRVSH